jgi:hypothetical protein
MIFISADTRGNETMQLAASIHTILTGASIGHVIGLAIFYGAAIGATIVRRRIGRPEA